jgi:hypothetical protein
MFIGISCRHTAKHPCHILGASHKRSRPIQDAIRVSAMPDKPQLLSDIRLARVRGSGLETGAADTENFLDFLK